jgi:serine/threonine protein kinase
MHTFTSENYTLFLRDRIEKPFELMDDLSGTQLGDYYLIKRIGRGGMSDVYKASSSRFNRPLAIKIMRPNAVADDDVFQQRFDQEIRIIESLDHEHILPVLDHGLTNGHTYMVMPYVEGGTLAKILRRHRLGAEDTGGWLYQIASALDHAHEHGVIHRDLKPTNILLDGQGNSFLVDFGIAKLIDMTNAMTMTGNVLGTPTYMAPEQWRGEKLTEVTDVYGLGVLVYLMLTGKPPFEADAPHTLMYKHLSDPVPTMKNLVPEIPDAVDQVVLKALAKRVKHRYPSAGEFSHDFQRALRSLETLAQRQPPPDVKKRPVPEEETILDDMKLDAVMQPSPPLEPKSDAQMPPPVYGPPDLYRPGGQITYVPPNALFTPSFERALERTSRRSRLTCVWVALLIGLMTAIIYVVLVDPFNLLPASDDSAEDAPPVPATPVYGSEAEVETSFTDLNNVPLDQIVILSVTGRTTSAEPSGPITRIELEVNGEVEAVRQNFNVSSNEDFNTQFTFSPTAPGTYRLEVIPYQGSVPGRSEMIEIRTR